MQRLCTLVALFVFASLAHASEFEGCGEYAFAGIYEGTETKGEFHYVVLKGTLSQLTFQVKKEADIVNLASQIDRATKFKAKILKPMDGTRGELEEITELEFRVEKPLDRSEFGIKKLKSLKCKK